MNRILYITITSISFLSLSMSVHASERLINYANWHGSCNERRCLIKNNRSVMVDFDISNYFIITIPVSQAVKKPAEKLAISTNTGVNFTDIFRRGAGATLRIYVPEEYQKQLAKSSKLTVHPFGEFNIKNLNLIYKDGLLLLGMNED